MKLFSFSIILLYIFFLLLLFHSHSLIHKYENFSSFIFFLLIKRHLHNYHTNYVISSHIQTIQYHVQYDFYMWLKLFCMFAFVPALAMIDAFFFTERERERERRWWTLFLLFPEEHICAYGFIQLHAFVFPRAWNLKFVVSLSLFLNSGT